MGVVEMLCLANSRKYGRRCVAGMLGDGSWIRPVSETEDGSLPESACRLDEGRPIQPLDVVELAVAKADPRPHQPENWLITDEPWKLLRTRAISDITSFLNRHICDEPSIFGTRGRSVSWAQIRIRGVDHSLALVKVTRPLFRWSEWNPTQLRAVFPYRGRTYDFPMTFEDRPPPGRSASAWYLTISLGEPLERQGKDCYKLVAGAIEIP